jgi:hypothetical protein
MSLLTLVEGLNLLRLVGDMKYWMRHQGFRPRCFRRAGMICRDLHLNLTGFGWDQPCNFSVTTLNLCHCRAFSRYLLRISAEMAQSGRNKLYSLDPALEAQLTLSSFEASPNTMADLTHLMYWIL